VTGTYSYDAFGVVRAQTGVTTEWSYTGEQNDPTGLEYLRARYYDPATGRFLSQDPLPLLQRYPYASNNPTNFIDPSGLYDGRAGAAVLLAAAAAAGPGAAAAAYITAAMILRDPCWITHAFCPHPPFNWKATSRIANGAARCSSNYGSICPGLWLADKIATPALCAWNRESYVDFNIARGAGAIGTVGIQGSCSQGLHPYVGLGAGSPGASLTVGLRQQISEGLGCGAQVSAGYAFQGGLGGGVHRSESLYGEVGVGTGGFSYTCFWIGPRP
jgi:RHS repeat-associated protein